MKSLRSLICPSLLSADFAFLGRDALHMLECGADWLHVDVMDGHFVNNITIGAPVVKSLRKAVPNAFLDCHLMVENPERWVSDFSAAGANQFTFHIEATSNPMNLIQQIREAGMQVGLSVKPKTALSDDVMALVPHIDTLLIMTVEPGFGGQSFMEDMMEKVQAARARFPSLNIQVDGGLNLSTIDTAASAGANCIVAGSGIFGTADHKETITALRNAVDRCL